MRSVKELRRKAASRVSRKARVYSTSEARANFAEALETAQVDNAVIGFDRYGRTIAALVPIEAVYMLAGMGHMIAPGVREEIASFSAQFVHSVPSRVAAPEPAPRTKRAAKKTESKKKKKKTKGKRGPKSRGGRD
jgi:hypothetical protein